MVECKVADFFFKFLTVNLQWISTFNLSTGSKYLYDARAATLKYWTSTGTCTCEWSWKRLFWNKYRSWVREREMCVCGSERERCVCVSEREREVCVFVHTWPSHTWPRGADPTVGVHMGFIHQTLKTVPATLSLLLPALRDADSSGGSAWSPRLYGSQHHWEQPLKTMRHVKLPHPNSKP